MFFLVALKVVSTCLFIIVGLLIFSDGFGFNFIIYSSDVEGGDRLGGGQRGLEGLCRPSSRI